MACVVECKVELGAWNGLTQAEQEGVAAYVSRLEERDVRLGFSYSSGIDGSRHSRMREARVQSGGNLTALVRT